MTIQKALAVMSAVTFICGASFVGGASAQGFDVVEDDPWAYSDNDFWGDDGSSSSPAPSSSSSFGSDDPWSSGFDEPYDAPAGPEPTVSNKPAKPAKPAKEAKPAKPVKQPKTKAPKQAKAKHQKAQKAPKPAKEPRAAAAVSSDDGTLNVFGSIGAGFGAGGYLLASTNIYPEGTSQGGTPRERTDHYINLGQGLRVEAGVGYMVTPSLEARGSADINFGLFAPEIKQEYGGGTRTYEISKYSFYSFSFKAMAVPHFEMLEAFDAYVGGGLMLGFAGASYDSTHTRGDDLNRSITYERQFAAPALGFCGIVGAVFPLSDQMSFFGELHFESIGFRLTKDRMKSHNVTDNANQPRDRIYEKNAPGSRPPVYFPGSAMGVKAGIRYWVF